MSGSGGYYAVDHYDGVRCLAITTGRVWDPGSGTYIFTVGSASQTVSGFDYGKLYSLTIWAKSETPDIGLPLIVSVIWPDSTTQVVIDGYPFQAGTWTELDGTFCALAPSCTVKIELTTTNSDLHTIFFDAASSALSGGPMAVLLAERAIGQLLLALQDGTNGLAAELTKIQSERGDSITTAGPDRWYTAPRAELSSDAVAVEAFADVIRFVDQEKRLPAWTLGVREAMPSEIDVTIRLTHANRGMVPLGTMRKRTDRYTAALARVLRNFPTLMDTTGFVRWAQLREARTTTEDQIVDNEGRIVVDRLTMGITVNLNEGSSGEGVASGGVPPSHTVSET